VLSPREDGASSDPGQSSSARVQEPVSVLCDTELFMAHKTFRHAQPAMCYTKLYDLSTAETAAICFGNISGDVGKEGTYICVLHLPLAHSQPSVANLPQPTPPYLSVRMKQVSTGATEFCEV
jgi:hypothetical protein